MAFFAIAGQTEATRGAGCWSLDNKKSGSARVALTGIRQTGEAAFFSRTAGLTYDPKSWALELDNEKSGNGRTARVAYDPRIWALESGQ